MMVVGKDKSENYCYRTKTMWKRQKTYLPKIGYQQKKLKVAAE